LRGDEDEGVMDGMPGSGLGSSAEGAGDASVAGKVP
jgi:hypothetical protein